MGAAGIIQIVMAVLTALPKAITAAESIYGALTGRGSVKKQYVLDTVSAAMQVAAATGNDDAAKPEVQKAVQDVAGTAVDSLVGTFNALNLWGTGDAVGSK